MERNFRGGSRGGPRGMGNSTAPVNVGDELDVKIEAVGEKGDGIAKKDGFVLFVPGTKSGEQVKIRITKVLKKVGFAEVVGSSSGGQPAEQSSEEAGSEQPTEEAEEEYSGEDSENFGEEEQQ